MTLNFAANFLGLDSAATPFGLKAMQSLQELNDDKDKASDAQIMFMCLHAAGLTLIPTSIIGYRAAEHAANPADVMLPNNSLCLSSEIRIWTKLSHNCIACETTF
jgi:spore maturation protein SpmA